jgi:two-component system sensor histidine kinase BaeS
LTAVILSFFAARRISRPLQELTAAAEGLAEGNPGLRVQVATTDEIGSLAASFNRMAESLEAQERLRKQLVSNAAHELRTPLMVIRGELEGMIDGLLPTTPEALQSLHDEAARLAAILDGVDELTRAQSSALTINLQSTALVPFFQQIVSRFTTLASEQDIRITVKGDPALQARIDRDQFTRIIINLATNAFRAMPRGGQFDILVTKSNEHAVCFDIMDTGNGIEPEQLSHIFERFYKGKDGGLGLGLAIVKELVEAHGGTISVSSELGKGTCFLLELPD